LGGLASYRRPQHTHVGAFVVSASGQTANG
jgi:hypothetical protein